MALYQKRFLLHSCTARGGISVVDNSCFIIEGLISLLRHINKVLIEEKCPRMFFSAGTLEFVSFQWKCHLNTSALKYRFHCDFAY